MDVAASQWIDLANEQDASASLREAMARLRSASDIPPVWRAIQTDVTSSET
jgi:hypothetical protein